jgi:hypothetical protein
MENLPKPTSERLRDVKAGAAQAKPAPAK